METLAYGLAIAAILAGTAFSMIGIIGLVRLPDVYTRLHATGKVSVFGVVLLLIAALLLTPSALGKGLILMLLLVVAGPVTSHALSSAAYRMGIPMRRSIRDDLAARGRPEPPDPELE
jgi:multicomponent Na+:H+ antiporter subunit G